MKAYYINLDKRVDRRKQIEDEMRRLGIDAERFPGIETTPGIIGCSYAHQAVLKKARDAGEPYALIFEDDFEATVPAETFVPLLQRALDETEFDVLLLSYNLAKNVPYASIPYNDYLVHILNAGTMSGYLVHQRFYDTLISLFDRTNPIIRANPGLHYYFACDMAWRLLQPQYVWFGFSPRLGKQRASFSDNTLMYEDYGV